MAASASARTCVGYPTLLDDDLTMLDMADFRMLAATNHTIAKNTCSSTASLTAARASAQQVSLHATR